MGVHQVDTMDKVPVRDPFHVFHGHILAANPKHLRKHPFLPNWCATLLHCLAVISLLMLRAIWSMPEHAYTRNGAWHLQIHSI